MKGVNLDLTPDGRLVGIEILDTKKKMANDVSPLQSNLLLLKIVYNSHMIGNSEVAILHRVFYDAGGLFHQENKENLENIFPWLSGVIMLKSVNGLPDQNVEGSFSPNPINKWLYRDLLFVFAEVGDEGIPAVSRGRFSSRDQPRRSHSRRTCWVISFN
ncbi:MAG: DUF2283 domain-containing protein [Candidatus Sumerlaeota bacterium]|nr:DUF2283 domain-containing protein [Candidatus Sumerlaeota bacterium]